LTLFCIFCSPVIAGADDPVRYDLTLELRTPVYNSLPHLGWDHDAMHAEFAGSLKLFNLLPGNAVFWVNGERTFHQTGVFNPENKMKVGIDLPIRRDLTVFTYFDRRFSRNVNRVFVGFRMNFKGDFD
jgi:hypothetical protein